MGGTELRLTRSGGRCQRECPDIESIEVDEEDRTITVTVDGEPAITQWISDAQPIHWGPTLEYGEHMDELDDSYVRFLCEDENRSQTTTQAFYFSREEPGPETPVPR